MDIVERSPGDIDLAAAAALADCSAKTLRRAAHLGQLPLRYVLGPRGLGLVFSREDLERWRACHPRRYARTQSRTPDREEEALPALPESLAGMRESLGAARAAILRLDGHLGQDAARAVAAIETLDGRLAEVERALSGLGAAGRGAPDARDGSASGTFEKRPAGGDARPGSAHRVITP